LRARLTYWLKHVAPPELEFNRLAYYKYPAPNGAKNKVNRLNPRDEILSDRLRPILTTQQREQTIALAMH
jgi:hypothetical protein